MAIQIEFQKKHSYESLKTGITLDVILHYRNREQLCAAKLIQAHKFACLLEP